MKASETTFTFDGFYIRIVDSDTVQVYISDGKTRTIYELQPDTTVLVQTAHEEINPMV